jgi:hypothetical protein
VAPSSQLSILLGPILDFVVPKPWSGQRMFMCGRSWLAPTDDKAMENHGRGGASPPADEHGCPTERQRLQYPEIIESITGFAEIFKTSLPYESYTQ